MGVIGEVDQLGRSNWNISVNGSRLELLKMGGICDKCRKKVVKGAGIFCGFFCVGRGKYPPRKRVWCGGCYVEYLKYDFPKYGKESVVDWEGELEGRYKKQSTGYNMLHYFKCDM